jgi:PEP-CTERM motif
MTQRLSLAAAQPSLAGSASSPSTPTASRKLQAVAWAAVACCAMAAPAHAAPIRIVATVTNLAAANSISFAPLHVGFNSGVFDAFNIGQTPGAPIISVAEGGAGGAWQTAFGAADPGAVRGTIGGLLTPGSTATSVFTVDPAVNLFFTFASMAVPSNDFFIGNDDAQEYRLFNAAGDLILNSISLVASDIWDAGSELFDPAAAAFVGTNALRTPQNGVVNFNFAELAGFNGLTTGAGYVFNSGLTANSPIYRITFQVPEPGSMALSGLGLLAVLGTTLRRRKAAAGLAA